MRNHLTKFLTASAFVIATSNANAALIGGIEFPDGPVSFADQFITYDPLFGGGPAPTDPDFLDPAQALGIPDYDEPLGSVSLGDGGRIVLRFDDNKLTGSGDSDPDLHIFEVGPDVEDTFVDISKDGLIWESVGKVFGATSSIDIDAFGFGIDDLFEFVRLTDDTAEGDQTGSTVGADIDAVGAISTVETPPVDIPEPASVALLLTALLALRARRRATG